MLLTSCMALRRARILRDRPSAARSTPTTSSQVSFDLDELSERTLVAEQTDLGGFAKHADQRAARRRRQSSKKRAFGEAQAVDRGMKGAAHRTTRESRAGLGSTRAGRSVLRAEIISIASMLVRRIRDVAVA